MDYDESNDAKMIELISAAKSQVKIVEIISEHTTLKLKGKRYVGICPFCRHEDGQFFTVSKEERFACYTCGEGGDIFNFVQKFKKVSFLEALRIIVDKYDLDSATEAVTNS